MTPSDTQQNRKYQCRDCASGYHTDLGAGGHADYFKHVVGNTETGEVFDYA